MNEIALRKILTQLGIKVAGRHADWLQFSCPFAKWTHRNKSDTNPSAGAVIDMEHASTYYCYGCKMKGSLSSLVRTLENYRGKKYPGLALEADVADAQIDFGDFETRKFEDDDVLGEPIDEAALGELYEPAWDVPAARHYLKERRIGKDTALHLELGYDPDEARVIFPVRHVNKGLYGYTGRSILKPEQYPYANYPKVRDYLSLPKRNLMLGAHFVGERPDPSYPIFVVEGLFGYANMFEIGADEYVNPVALMGSEFTPGKVGILREWDTYTVLAVDDDEGGETALWGAYDAKINRFKGGGGIDKLRGHIPFSVPAWPEGKNDPDQLSLEDVKRMAFKTPHWRKA